MVHQVLDTQLGAFSHLALSHSSTRLLGGKSHSHVYSLGNDLWSVSYEPGTVSVLG